MYATLCNMSEVVEKKLEVQKSVDDCQEKMLKILFVLIWVLTFIHMVAEYYHLYYHLSWFDIVTHFLGGVWLGLAVVWL